MSCSAPCSPLPEASPASARPRNATRRSLSLAVGCVLCVCLSVPASAAESFPLSFRAPGDLPEPVKDSLQALAQKHAENMFLHLELKIKQIDEDCGLSQPQRAKLEAAAMGAVQDALEEWLAPILSELATGSAQDRDSLIILLGGQGTTLSQFVQNGRLHVRRKFENEVIAERVIDIPQQAESLNIFELVSGRMQSQPIRLKLEEFAVLNHPIFIATLDAELTNQQRQKCAEAEAEREAKRAEAEKLRLQELAEAQVARDAMRLQTRTERLAREIGRRLSLNDAQQKQVAEVIEQMSREPVVRWRTSRSGVSPRVAADFTLPYLPAEKMQQILTPGQLAVWREIAGRTKSSDAAVPGRADAEQIINAVE